MTLGTFRTAHSVCALGQVDLGILRRPVKIYTSVVGDHGMTGSPEFNQSHELRSGGLILAIL